MDVENFHKRLNELYMPPEDEFSLVDVPAIRFAMIDGAGNPQSASSKAAVKWLYSLVHVVKPQIQERMGKKFVYPPIEYLHWADNEADFIAGNKENWKWRAMIVFVDWITDRMFAEATAKVEIKLGSAPDTLRLDVLEEGQCVQIMHKGDYGEISAICTKLYNDFLPQKKLKPNGYYHEIFLNDPARTAPDKRKTIVRQPVA